MEESDKSIESIWSRIPEIRHAWPYQRHGLFRQQKRKPTLTKTSGKTEQEPTENPGLKPGEIWRIVEGEE